MGSQPIGRVHLTEGIFPSIWPYSICLASTPALQAGESSSTLDRVTTADSAAKAPLHNSDGKPLEGIGLRKKSHPAVE